jgi:hypothetical protein
VIRGVRAIDPTRDLYVQLERVKTLTAAGILPMDIGNAQMMKLLSQIDGVLLTMPAKADEAAAAAAKAVANGGKGSSKGGGKGGRPPGK